MVYRALVGRITLRETQHEEVTTRVVTKHGLYASECDVCHLVFEMRIGQGTAAPLGQLEGLFDRVPNTGRYGNQFRATVCSFSCAHLLVGLDGWKSMPEYADHVQVGAEIQNVSLQITPRLTYGFELEQEWDARPRTVAPMYPMDTGTILTSGGMSYVPYIPSVPVAPEPEPEPPPYTGERTPAWEKLVRKV